MSTDKQDLSPDLQRAAIARYAEEHGLSIVRRYLDAGKSGLTLSKRSAMKQLLADITDGNRGFTVVLVYDISRWGRFQDTDASAYYEYHCRLHGVDVRYVQEPFASMDSPLGALLKNFKRTMAAEYSRELAVKTTAGQSAAVHRGFQLGTMPCMGISRVAVSKADGSERPLGPHDHKASRGEHMKWIPGPPEEVAGARRIFGLYATTELSVVEVARIAHTEGIRARNGRPVTEWMLYRMLRSEVFVGNFVWGREENKKRRDPADTRIRRSNGIMLPIIDREVFDKVQEKLSWREHTHVTKQDAIDRLKAALLANPRLVGTDLRAHGCPCRETYLKLFGSMKAAWDAAGFRQHVADEQTHALGAKRLREGAATCRSIHDLLRVAGVDCIYYRRADRNSQTLLINGRVILRTQVVRRIPRGGHLRWCVRKAYKSHFDWALIVRMNEDGSAFDSLLVNRCDYFALDRWLPDVMHDRRRVHTDILEIAQIFRDLAVQ